MRVISFVISILDRFDPEYFFHFEQTKKMMLDKIAAQGAQVTVHGADWNAADELARSLVAADPTAVCITCFCCAVFA